MLESETFDREVARAVQSPPAALVVCDLDGFKEVNDDFGHEAGNDVLRAFERALEGNVPSGASVSRKGGDEYAVLLPGCTPEEALILMEEIRAHFASRPPAPGVTRIVDVSIGVAGVPAQAQDAETLKGCAVGALHRAKRQERGRAAIYVEERMVLKSSYYPRRPLAELAKLSDRSGRTEASLLREALDDLLGKHAKEL